MTRDFILDAWPIMVWLKRQQPAAEKMRALFEAAERGDCRLWMNVVNLGEVFYLCAKARNLSYGERVFKALQPRIGTVSADDELVMLAATLRAQYAISYADGFAVSTALQQNMPLVTGDPEIRALAVAEKKLKLEWIGQ